MANNGPNLVGSFLPTTNIWDPSILFSTDLEDQAKLKELLAYMYLNLNRMSIAINLKDTGFYDIQEFVSGQLFFPNPSFNSSTTNYPEYRQAFRMIVNFGALPNTSTKSVAHNIPVMSLNGAPLFTSFTRIYGCATSPNTLVAPASNYKAIPLPYASSGGLIVELNVDATNVNITTNMNATNYTTTYIVLEYIQT